MSRTVGALWRHPVKAVGRERVTEAVLVAGEGFPGDRVWAVAHEDARIEGEAGWVSCRNFARAASSPALMAVEAVTEDGRLRLSHPDRPPLDVDPDAEPEAIPAWIAPLVERSRPARTVRRGVALTDSDFPSVSIGGTASLRALSGQAGRPLDPARFRMNLWVEGLGPWEEFEWVGRSLRIGEAEMRVPERIVRCRAPEADPATGRRNADPLRALEEGWGHREFGVYGVVTRPGRVAEGDRLEVL